MCAAEHDWHVIHGKKADLHSPPTLDRLAGELSSALIQVPADDIDASIDGTLQRIGEALDVDRCTLVEWKDDSRTFETPHSWARAGIPAVRWTVDRTSLPWYLACLMRGEIVALGRLPDDLPADVGPEREYVRRTGQKAVLTIPVAVAGRPTCALSVGSFRAYRSWKPEIVERLRFIAEILAAAIHRSRQEHVIQEARGEVERLTRQLESENLYLKEEIKVLHGFDEIVGDSAVLRAALEQVQEVAPTDSTVLLLGETGTGKELFARAIHDRSPRRQRPLVRVSCAALPATLIESELFGHDRGAFTGATSARQGRFELADRGTLFLDEIGDLPLELQAKLLRVLQEGEFERLGSSHTRKADVRVVAATNRDLDTAVEEGRFRADLYYRLSVYPIRLPSLRERPDDIPKLVWFFVHHRKRTLHRSVSKVPSAVMQALQHYDWPGNVRELENVIERAMIRSTADTLILDQGPIAKKPHSVGATPTGRLDEVERRHIEAMLRRCGWRINGAGNAAEHLGLHPNTLRFRMKKLGIVRPSTTGPKPRSRTAR